MTTATILAWTLISISSGAYNQGDITIIKDYETRDECYAVVQFNQNLVKNTVSFDCIKTKLETLKIEAKEVKANDVLTLSDGRIGVVNTSIVDPGKKDIQKIEFQNSKMKNTQFYRVFLPFDEIVSVAR